MTEQPRSESLEPLRQRIDLIDRDLVRLLSERAQTAQAIGRAKATTQGAVFVPHREHEVFQHIAEMNAGPLPDLALKAIWREIMSASLALEHPLSICHFGQAGAFTHLAATLKFGQSVQYTGVDSITTVFAEIERGHADYGVVPIENSTDGSITDTIDAFLATNLKMINEIHVRIRHHLMARCKREQIKRIYSRNTVFAQCRQWLSANMPNCELIEVVSTTKAAERASTEDFSAAIGQDDAAKRYSLNIITSDVQDNANNMTRFVVIAKPERAAQRTGDDKTSVMFGVQDRPGALYDCLLPFHQGKLNLSRIESRPSRRRPWEYLFFIDFSGHQADSEARHALAELGKHTSMLEVLGSYPRADQPLND